MLLSAILLAAAAQLPEDPGLHAAGWQDIWFQDANFGQGYVQARIHYPALSAGQGAAADPASGPYPVVAMLHGWLGSADGLDDLSNHLVSHGYLVASIDTHSGLNPDTMDYARNVRSMLHWVEDESSSPASWLAGMAAPGDWSAVGHSMGGGTLSLLIGLEPRVRNLVGMQAAETDAIGTSNMQAFDGTSLWIAGDVDNIVPPTVVHRWFDRSLVAARCFYFNVDGMGHGGPNDFPPLNEPMPGAQQHAVHRRLVTVFLEAQVRGQDNLYHHAFGSQPGFPWAIEQDCPEPLFWGGRHLSVQSAEFGLHGAVGDTGAFAWSSQLGSTATPFGPADLDLSFGGSLPAIHLGAQGWGRDDFLFGPGLSGTTLYFQAATYGTGGGSLTRSFAVVVP